MYPKTFFDSQPHRPESDYCFILMPFADGFREIYDTIAEALEDPELGFACQRADELFGGGHIIEDILRSMARAEVIIADLTTKNPNVFYELGIAHMVKDIEKVLILTQDMDDVPFDLRHFRCIVYEQSPTGLRRLKRQLTDAVQQIARRTYKFSVKEGETYKFTDKLAAPDRCLYDFEISQLMTGSRFVKFYMKVFRHIIGEPIETVESRSYGMAPGESMPLFDIPWLLRVDRVISGSASFSVMPTDN